MTNPRDERWPELDRLVDGELEIEGRRALFARLDANPDGWRRCALAFLEAQAWREALGPRPPATWIDGAVPNPGKPASRPRRLPTRVALAAGVLAAFGLGWLVGGSGRGEVHDLRVAAPFEEGRAGGRAVGPAPATGPVTTVAVVDLDGATEDSAPYPIPILSGPGLDEDWLQRQPSALPEYVQRQWERSGYLVERRRRLVSLDLDEGRRLAFPVDQIDFRYVGPDPF